MKTCPRCGYTAEDNAQTCQRCGYQYQTTTYNYNPQSNNYDRDNALDACGPEGKSRGVAALLAIILGGLGIQYFYLGRVEAGIITIVLSLVTCGLWSTVMLIQGILMLCMTNNDFRQKYVLSRSTLPLF